MKDVGEGADLGLAGARVTMVTGGAGSYAEFIAVDAAMAVRVPDGLSAAEAVAVAAPAAMALGLLDRAAALSDPHQEVMSADHRRVLEAIRDSTGLTGSG